MVMQVYKEKNNFSQYGGWILNTHEGRDSMYTRDREGIVDIPLPYGIKPDSQNASCGSHIAFGHGPQIEDVTRI